MKIAKQLGKACEQGKFRSMRKKAGRPLTKEYLAELSAMSGGKAVLKPGCSRKSHVERLRIVYPN
jgi:hypothetical protein